jgi:sterol desaturase/sphingolipid hydroxylase (fatty acid hydroxylase superfamily)
MLSVAMGVVSAFTVSYLLPPLSISESIMMLIVLLLSAGFISSFSMPSQGPLPPVIEKNEVKVNWGNESWYQIRWRNLAGVVSGTLLGIFITLYTVINGYSNSYSLAPAITFEPIFILFPVTFGILLGLLGGFLGLLIRDRYDKI